MAHFGCAWDHRGHDHPVHRPGWNGLARDGVRRYQWGCRMIDYIVLQRIEEGLRTRTKVVLPSEYHVRGDYIQVLVEKGWGRSQIAWVTGWNCSTDKEPRSSVISQAFRVTTEGIPAGSKIVGADPNRDTTRFDGVAICAGPLKIIVEGGAETIAELAERMMESAKAMQAEAELLECGA